MLPSGRRGEEEDHAIPRGIFCCAKHIHCPIDKDREMWLIWKHWKQSKMAEQEFREENSIKPLWRAQEYQNQRIWISWLLLCEDCKIHSSPLLSDQGQGDLQTELISGTEDHSWRGRPPTYRGTSLPMQEAHSTLSARPKHRFSTLHQRPLRQTVITAL